MQNVKYGNFDFENELGLKCLTVKSEFVNSDSQTIDIPGSRGNYYQGSKTKDRKHEAEFLLEADSEAENLERMTELNKLFRQMIEANALFQLNLSKQEDVFYDSYIAAISAPSFISGTFNSTFTITFMTPSGTGYKTPEEVAIIEEAQEVFVEGNSETYPIFRGIAKKNNITAVSIANKKNYIHLGQTLDAGITPESKRTRLIFDNCSDPSTWTQVLPGNPLTFDGQNTAAITTNGYSLSVSPEADWGTPTDPKGWHGGIVYKTLETPVFNYKVEALLRFANKYPRAKGAGILTLFKTDNSKHLQIEIKDEENGKKAALVVKIYNEETGKMQIIYNGETTLNETDGETTEKTLDYKYTTTTPRQPINIDGSIIKVNIWKAPYWDIQANAGDNTKIRGHEKRGVLLTVKEELTINGAQFYKLKSNTFIRKADVILTSKKSSNTTQQTSTTTSGKLTVEETNGTNEFTDFYGWVSVLKTDNRYEIMIEKVSTETGLRTGRNFHVIFYDTFNEYSENVLVKYIAFQSFKKQIEEDAKQIFYSEVWAALAEIYFHEYNGNNREQVLLNTGDEIVIDTEKNKVFRNGQLFLENLSLGSTFFSLLGEEFISFSNSTEDIEWKMFYKPRVN